MRHVLLGFAFYALAAWHPHLKDQNIMWSDIIPEFPIPGDGTFPGLNNTTEGLAILANDCQFVTPVTPTTPTTPTQPPGQPGAGAAPSGPGAAGAAGQAGAAAAVTGVPRVTG